jgi:hypothetical protein
MFTYDVITMGTHDYDGSYTVESYRVSRSQALAWMKSDRFLDLQVTHDTFNAPKAEPSAYDLIAF